jgi:hypothetical protein
VERPVEAQNSGGPFHACAGAVGRPRERRYLDRGLAFSRGSRGHWGNAAHNYKAKGRRTAIGANKPANAYVTRRATFFAGFNWQRDIVRYYKVRLEMLRALRTTHANGERARRLAEARKAKRAVKLEQLPDSTENNRP